MKNRFWLVLFAASGVIALGQSGGAIAPFTVVISTKNPTVTSGKSTGIEIEVTNLSPRALNTGFVIDPETGQNSNNIFEIRGPDGNLLLNRYMNHKKAPGNYPESANIHLGMLKPGETSVEEAYPEASYDMTAPGVYMVQLLRRIPGDRNQGVVKSNAIMITVVPAEPPSGAQPKTIIDSAEYNAYLGAVGQADPHQKAIAMEAFLARYSGSVVKEEALKQLVLCYQQLNDVPKTTDAANRVLQVNPNSLPALVLLTYFSRLQAQQNPSQSPQLMSRAAQFAERGMRALQRGPAIPDAEFENLKAGSLPIFNGAKGQAALAGKDYATAQQALRAAVDANPNNADDVYLLAVAFLQSKPKVEQLSLQEALSGLWYMARAVNLMAANPTAQQQIATAGKYYFTKYHGSQDGWQQLVAQAASSATPPSVNGAEIKSTSDPQ